MTNLLTRPILFTLACLTTACSVPQEAPSGADDPAFLFPQMNRAVLTVSRVGSAVDDGCIYRVAINSIDAGTLAPKGWISMYPPAGAHLVSVRTEGVACPAAVQVRTQLEANRQQRLQIVRGANGSLAWGSEDPPSP